MKEQQIKVTGSLVLFLANTLAAHQIGGFKVGVGFSLRKCRNCLATLEDMNIKVMLLCPEFIIMIYDLVVSPQFISCSHC